MFLILFHVHVVELYVNGRTGHHVNVSTRSIGKFENERAIVIGKFFTREHIDGYLSFRFSLRNGKVEERNSLDCNPACGKETDHYENDYCDGSTEWNPWQNWRTGLKGFLLVNLRSRLLMPKKASAL